MKTLIISFLLSFSFCINGLYAQLTFESDVENSVVSVSYLGDSMSLFAVKASGEGFNEGKAVLTLSDAALWTVLWEKLESTGYVAVGGEVLSNNAVSMNNQGDGIYRVTANKGSETVNMSFAIVNQYINNFTISVENPEACDCINIGINSLNIIKPVFLENLVFAPVDNFELLRSGETIASVLSNTPLETIQDCNISPNEVDYQVRITDRYGFVWLSDIINFESKVPKAMFSFDPLKGEAPLEVDFINESENANSYSWYIYKDFSTLGGAIDTRDSLWIDVDNSTDISYIYKHPGKYAVKLIAINTDGENQCKSEYILKDGNRIAVDSSLVQVPNVFTPNGDGKNDIFRVKAQSLKSFHAVVFNRLGRKVCEWDDPMDGWDGRIGGSYAAPGTYFFIIEAVGAEQDNKKYVKKGTVLLIRER